MAISIIQHRALFAVSVIATFNDLQPNVFGLDTFFPQRLSETKAVAINIKRYTKRMSSDIVRNSNGNRVTYNKETQKMFIPPLVHEYTDVNAIEGFDNPLDRGQEPSASQQGIMGSQVVERLDEMRSAQMRFIEHQRAQVLIDGSLSFSAADSIDYRRLASSMVALTGGNTWDNDTADIIGQLSEGAEFLKTEGKSQAVTHPVIFGRRAFRDFQANTEVKERLNLRRSNRVELVRPEDRAGLTFHGFIAIGDVEIEIWTYPDYYEDEAGAKIYYIPQDTVCMIAGDFFGVTAYGGITEIVTNEFGVPVNLNIVATDFFVWDVIHPDRKAHEFHMETAPVVIPASVDRLYTLTTRSA